MLLAMCVRDVFVFQIVCLWPVCEYLCANICVRIFVCKYLSENIGAVKAAKTQKGDSWTSKRALSCRSSVS